MATISYILSQPMAVDLLVYDSNVIIQNSSGTWPPAVGLSTPVFSMQGTRPARLKVTEFWDGRNPNGVFMPDGLYPYILAAKGPAGFHGQYASDRIQGYVAVSRGQIMLTQFSIIPTVPTMFNSSETIKLPPLICVFSTSKTSKSCLAINFSRDNSE